MTDLSLDLKTYNALVELAVFHCMVPQAQFEGALAFLNSQAQRLPPAKKRVSPAGGSVTVM